MFTWRLSRNFEKQPDKESADFRKQECLFYGCVDDDGGDLFVKRKAVKEIWHGLGMEQPRSKFDTKISRVLSELFFTWSTTELLWERREDKHVQVFTTLWHWWKNINKITENETPMSGAVLVRRTKCSTVEYLQFFSNTKSSEVQY
jgi:hypothetical protein